MAVRALALWREHERGWKQRLLHPIGVLWLVEDDDSYEKAALPLLKEAGCRFQELSGAETAKRYPQINCARVRWAIFERDGGYLTARRACAAVFEGLLAAGGMYRQVAVQPPSPGEALRCSDGSTLAGDAYVFACGPWLGKLFPEVIGDRVRATRQEVFFFGTPPGDARFTEEALPVWADHANHFMYGIPGNEWRGFKVADDARGPAFDPTAGERVPSPEALRSARDYLAYRFPGLVDRPVRAKLEHDFERFKRALPPDFAAHVRAAYRIDLTGRYAGEPLPHPIGKGSGQLSLNAGQLEEDAAAGLAFVVLKTVIAEDDAGVRAMAAWAIHETRMRVERRAAADGRPGWTVTWKGRGWDRTLDEYVALVRAGRDLTRAGGPLVVPSVKYHLPRLDEPFRDAEYRHTTARVAQAWGTPPLIVEKDFSPTLAGDTLADDRAQILRWLREVPGRIRAAAPLPVRVAVKLMNARFDDAFQLEMMRAAAAEADALVCFNRLFDAQLGLAYGGWDLSDRNLRVLDTLTPHASAGIPGLTPALTGTGNI